MTSIESLTIDASEIVERALENLHDDAGVPEKEMNELQAFLEDWCKKNHTNTKTYYADYQLGVICN